jgi:primosomal protein N'
MDQFGESKQEGVIIVKIQKVLFAIMLIMLTIPNITLAEENSIIVEQHSKDWQDKREERKKEILQMVEKYSPEKLDEWKKAFSTKDELLSKIDKDEWHNHHKGMDEKQWKIIRQKKREAMRELKEAAKNGDEEKVDEMLNNMLTKLKEDNQRLLEKTS